MGRRARSEQGVELIKGKGDSLNRRPQSEEDHFVYSDTRGAKAEDEECVVITL
jgi:hypothetical protein